MNFVGRPTYDTVPLMKKITPARGPISGTVYVPGSKSISNRALLLAAISPGVTRLKGLLHSDDTEACLVALQNLGVAVQDCGQNEWRIEGHSDFTSASIDCRDAGTVSRFLIPICAAVGGDFQFYGTQRLSERPMKPLFDVLIDQGVDIKYLEKPGFLPIHMKSTGIKGGKVQVEMKDSSQFVSGLLLASAYAKTPLVIDQDLEAKPYVQMTLRMMKDFATPLPPHGERVYSIEPDASTASYFFAAAALTGGRVTVPGLSFDVMQGDIRFLKLLEKMGATVTEGQNGLTVQGPETLKGLGTVDMTGFTDTFMTLSAIAPFADASTTITGLRHTRLQESDRVEAMRQGLSRLGVHATTTEDSIIIHPGGLHGGHINSHNDHRIAMSHALIGLKIPGVIIDGAECVKKTCPQFFELLNALIK